MLQPHQLLQDLQDLVAAHTTVQLPGDLGLGVEEVT